MERQNQHDPENQKSDIMMELSAEQVRSLEFSIIVNQLIFRRREVKNF